MGLVGGRREGRRGRRVVGGGIEGPVVWEEGRVGESGVVLLLLGGLVVGVL